MILEFRVQTGDETDLVVAPEDLIQMPRAADDCPRWCRRDYIECRDCPRLDSQSPCCAPALVVHRLSEQFSRVVSYDRVKLTIVSELGSTTSECDAQNALFHILRYALSGCACPQLAIARWAFEFYSPFWTTENLFYRALTAILVRDYLRGQGLSPGPDRSIMEMIEKEKGVLERLVSKTRGFKVSEVVVNALVHSHSINQTIQEEWSSLIENLKKAVLRPSTA